jgi:hypothetical protein
MVIKPRFCEGYLGVSRSYKAYDKKCGNKNVIKNTNRASFITASE